MAGWRDDESDAIRLWAQGDVPRVTVDRPAQRSRCGIKEYCKSFFTHLIR